MSILVVSVSHKSTSVSHLAQLALDAPASAKLAEQGVGIGVIATPAIAAQAVCDRMVEVGIRSILNFAPTILSVPEGVDVRRVDLSSELQILAYHEQRKSAATEQAEPVAPVAQGVGGAR